jgi:hypothetical protein
MTISERREITFDADEVLTALKALDANSAANLGLPNNRPIAVKFDPVGAYISAKYDPINHDTAGLWITLDGPPLAVLLMNLCRSKHMPLPRHATKFIRIMNDSVVLGFNSIPVLLPQADQTR